MLLTRAGILFSIISIVNAFGRIQTVGVKGKLMCGDRPLTNTKIKLWDNDSGPDLDDLMAETKTDNSGHFELHGSASEITTIDPILKIYHDCDDGIMPCQRKVSFIIPDHFVAQGKEVKSWFDIGSVNMQIIFEKEERDCVNRR